MFLPTACLNNFAQITSDVTRFVFHCMSLSKSGAHAGSGGYSIEPSFIEFHVDDRSQTMTDEPRLQNSRRYEKTLSIHLSQKPLWFPLRCVYMSSWRHFCPWAQDFPPVMIFATSNFVRLTFLFSSMFASASEYSLVNRCGRGGGLSGQAVERERHEVCLRAARRLFAFMVFPSRRDVFPDVSACFFWTFQEGMWRCSSCLRVLSTFYPLQCECFPIFRILLVSWGRMWGGRDLRVWVLPHKVQQLRWGGSMRGTRGRWEWEGKKCLS